MLETKRILFSYYWFLLLLVACTKELGYQLDTDNALVLSSVLEPGESMKCYIGTTRGFFEDEAEENDDLYRLQVNQVAEDESVLVEIIDTPVPLGLFDTKQHISLGGNYKFILSNGHGDTVTAIESIPKITFIEKVEMEFPVGLDDDNNEYGAIYITFEDDSSQTNYYEIWDNLSEYIPVTDPVILNEGDIEYRPSTYFFSDEMFNGKKITISISGNYYARYDSQDKKYYLNQPRKVRLRSISKNYHNYKKYITRHLYNQQFQGDFWDLIYMSEPQNMYSNVVGGFGIVTSL